MTEKAKIVIDNILNRRTVKPEDCTGEKIDDSLVWQILECANWAPTHGYTEPWRFVVFAHEAKNTFSYEHAEMYKLHTEPEKFKNVSYQKIIDRGSLTSHIIALIMKRGNNPKIPATEELAALSCAVQNMQLAAASLNLAAYWNTGGMTFHPAMKNYFNLEEEDLLMGFLYLGVPMKDKEFKGRRMSTIQDKVVWRG
jgi:nitroreductase